jgi:hypothetical protein
MFMDVCDELPEEKKDEHFLIDIAIPLGRESPPKSVTRPDTPSPRPSFISSMYRRFTQRRPRNVSRNTSTSIPHVTKEEYRHWYFKQALERINKDSAYLPYIHKSVLVDKQFARLTVDKKFDITDGTNKLKFNKPLTYKQINAIKDDILELYADDIAEVKVFVHNYLAIRLKDIKSLHAATSRNLVSRKTRSNYAHTKNIMQYLG